MAAGEAVGAGSFWQSSFAIADRAAAVILAHNHPSGLLEPTPQDLEVTRQLAEAGRILGIQVLDHIIVSPKGFLSLKAEGYL